MDSPNPLLERFHTESGGKVSPQALWIVREVGNWLYGRDQVQQNHANRIRAFETEIERLKARIDTLEQGGA